MLSQLAEVMPTLPCSAFGDVWVFNTDSLEWKRVEVGGKAPAPREMACGTMLSPSRLLVFGGRAAGGAILSDSAVLDMESCSWKQAADHAELGRCTQSAVLLPSVGTACAQVTAEGGSGGDDAGTVVIFGGFTGTDLAKDVVRALCLTSATVSGSAALCASGLARSTKLRRSLSRCSVQVLLDTASMKGRQCSAVGDDAPGPVKRFAHTACTIDIGGRTSALVFGGASAEADLNDVWLWQPR
jgi:hypothetical protein